MAKRCGNGSETTSKKPKADPSTLQQQAPQLPNVPRLPFKLALLNLEQIFRSLSPADILRFAMCSTRSYNLLNNNIRVPATRIRFKNEPSDVSPNFFVNIEMPDQRPCRVDFVATSRTENNFAFEDGTTLETSVKEKVWGSETRIKNFTPGDGTERICLVFAGNRDTRLVALDMFNFVRNVFKTTDIELISLGAKRDDDLFTVIRGVRRFSKVAIRWHTQNCMKNKDLQAVLETVPVDAMFLDVFSPRIKYTGHTNKRILMTRNASWLTGESLLKTNCETLIARGTKLTANDLNLFIDEWKTNTDKFGNLELIHIGQHERLPIHPEELNLEKWPPRGEYPRNVKVLHPENTWFCRRGDLMATLELRYNNIVMFRVWHEKYLTKEVNHVAELKRVRGLWDDNYLFD